MEKEIRRLTTKIELRANDDSSEEYIEGYALKFEKWSEEMGLFFRFKEIISRGALNETDMSNVVALFNHKEDYPLARNTVSQTDGKLELTVDNIGLKFRFKPTDTTYAKDLKENIRAGVVDQCSFAFSLDYEDPEAEEWLYNEDEDIYERRINKIKRLYDVAIVTYPAYPDTEAVVGQRSKEKVEKLQEIRQKPNKQVEKDKLLLEIDLLAI